MLGVKNIKMKVHKYKKLKDNRYELDLGEAKIILYDDVIVKYNLLFKNDLSKELLKEITLENDKLGAYYKALKYINIRQRSKKEIEKYLQKNEYDLDLITNTIIKLEQNKLINNDMYLQSYINDQLNFSNNGPIKIRMNLQNLGFNDDEISKYLDKSENIWQDKLNKIIGKRIALNKKDSERVFKEKLNNYLNNLGYSYEMYKNIIVDIKFNDDIAIKKDIDKLLIKLSKKYDKEQLTYYLKQKLYAKGYSSEVINKYLDK